MASENLPGIAEPSKPKMGRKPKRTLAEKLIEAQARDVVSRLDDDTLVDTELAAIYLHMSERQLEDLRRSGGGPEMVKAIEAGARRQNQPVRYAMGALRSFRARSSASGTFDAAVKAGLAGWVSTQIPFFAALRGSERRGRDVLIACAWEEDARFEAWFAALARGETRALWLTAAQASLELWSEPRLQAEFAGRGVELLRAEMGAIGAAVERSEIQSGLAESSVDE